MTEYLKQSRTRQRQRILFVYAMVVLVMIGLAGRLLYLMVNRADYYGEKAKKVHQRQRAVKAARGIIYDRNGTEIASNKPVSTISVIHNQIVEPEKVIEVLSTLLDLPEEKVRKRVEKVSSIEKIKSNVDKKISDKIRDMELAGVMVDEDYKRYYPYSEFASKVIGFTGADNQGIVGMEVAYDKYLQGTDGSILTMTTARGLEIDGKAEERVEPVAGANLYTISPSRAEILLWERNLRIAAARDSLYNRISKSKKQGRRSLCPSPSGSGRSAPAASTPMRALRRRFISPAARSLPESRSPANTRCSSTIRSPASVNIPTGPRAAPRTFTK